MTDDEIRDLLARSYPMGDEDPAKTPEAWTVADALLPNVRAIADDAETRGRNEVAAKVRWLADHIQALDVSHVKAPGLVARLRAIAPDPDHQAHANDSITAAKEHTT